MMELSVAFLTAARLQPKQPSRNLNAGCRDHAGTYGLEGAPWWSNAGRMLLPYPVGRRTQAARGGLFHNTLRFRGVVPGKTGRCHTGLVTRPITPVWHPGRRETNRPRGGPGARDRRAGPSTRWSCGPLPDRARGAALRHRGTRASPQGPAHSAQNQLGLGLSPRDDRRSNGLLHHLFRLPAAAGRSCHTTDHRLMQRLSGTARDFFVVAAISTINVEVVLGEFVRCFHRPPGNSSPTRRSTVGGGGTPEASPRPHRLWSRGDEVANVVELASGFGQKWRSIPQKYNRFDITDHHRSDMGPSKPRVAGSILPGAPFP